MNRQELWHIWKKMIFLVIFSFIIFLLLVNIFRVSLYMFEVNNVINVALRKDNEQINVINNHYNDYKEDVSGYDFNVAHSASQLNFVDAFKNGDLKNSDWDEGINILFTGSDKHNSHESRSRSDVIIIIRIKACCSYIFSRLFFSLSFKLQFPTYPYSVSKLCYQLFFIFYG